MVNKQKPQKRLRKRETEQGNRGGGGEPIASSEVAPVEPAHAAACMCVCECIHADMLIYSCMCNSLRLRLVSHFCMYAYDRD